MQFYKANGKKINYRLRCKEEDATFSARDLMFCPIASMDIDKTSV